MPKLSAGFYTTPQQSADCADRADRAMCIWCTYGLHNTPAECRLCRLCNVHLEQVLVNFTHHQSEQSAYCARMQGNNFLPDYILTPPSSSLSNIFYICFIQGSLLYYPFPNRSRSDWCFLKYMIYSKIQTRNTII